MNLEHHLHPPGTIKLILAFRRHDLPADRRSPREPSLETNRRGTTVALLIGEQMQDHASPMRPGPVLKEVDTLPGPQRQPALMNGNR